MIKRITNRQDVNVAATYVYHGQTNPMNEQTHLNVGGGNELLVKFTGVDLSTFDRVGRAILRMIITQDPTIIQNPTTKEAFYVQRNTQDFNPEEVMWNNKPTTSPSYDSGFLVPHIYTVVGDMDPKFTIVELDLTSIFNHWKHQGICFHGITITRPNGISVVINPNENENEGLKEFFIIEDSKTFGLEQHLSHTSINCGFAGTGQINDLTGQLVFQTTGFQTSSNSVAIRFAAYRTNKNLNGYEKTNLMGSVFRSDVEYAIKRNELYMQLAHPDGSESFFTKMTKEEAANYGINASANEVYVDLSSYAYASHNGNEITIFYPDLTKVEFLLHRLHKITVPTGDTIQYYWNANHDKLLYIMNSDGERVDVLYDTNNRIKAVDFINDQRLIAITYHAYGDEISSYTLKKWILDPSSSSGDRLYYDLESATYSKTETHYTVVDVKNDDRTEFQIAEDLVYSVTLKKQASGEKIQELHFTRDIQRTTIEDFYGNKHLLYFDYYGQLTHRLDEQGNSIKAYYELAGKDGTSRKMTSKSNIHPNRNNLITDFSFDANVGEYKTDTQGWQKNTNTNNIVKSVDGGVFGQKCLMIRKTGSGQTKVTQTIVVNPGTYSFIGFEKRQAISGNPKIKAIATYTILRPAQESETGIIDESGNVWVNDTVTTEVSTDGLSGTTTMWQQFTLSPIIIPTGATNATIELQIYASHSSGDLLIDDFQLVASEHAINYNLIPNGYFNENQGDMPTGWSHENLDSFDKIVESSLDYPYHVFVGTRVMRFLGDFTKTKKLYKTFDVIGSLGDELVFSGWFKGRVLFSEEAKVALTFVYESGLENEHAIHLGMNESDWQNVNKGFIAKNAYKQVKISIEYRGFNTILFDALQLVINTNETHFVYDDLGNITDQFTAKASSESISNALGQIVQSSHQQGDVYRYKYDNKRRLAEVKDNKGNKVVHTYDSKSNLTQMEITSSSGVISHARTYNTKNQLLKFTDEFGRETINIYDNEYRHVETIDASGHIDKNEYNEFNQLTKIIRESATGQSESLSYEYDTQRNLKKIIIDPNKYYEFFHDDFDRVEKVKINQSTIVKYTYTQKHQIETQTYGETGDFYRFTYDAKGRLATVTFNDIVSTSCEYKYDELDRISEVKHKGVITYYSYDRSGKLMRKTSSEGQSERFVYDSLDAIQKSIVDVNGLIRSFEYIMPYETSQYHFDGFMSRLDKAYDDDHILVDSNYNGQTGLKAYAGYGTTIEDDAVLRTPVLVVGSNAGEVRYRMSEANARRAISKLTGKRFDYSSWKNKFDHKKTLFGWFKFSSRAYDQPVFSITTGTYSNQIEVFLQPNGQFKLRIKGQYHAVPSSTYQYSGEGWVQLGLQIENSNGDIETKFFISGAKVLETTQNIKLLPENTVDCRVANFERLILGLYNPDSFPITTSLFKVAHMVVGAYDHDEPELAKIDGLAQPYFEGTVDRKQRSGVLYHDHVAYDGLDVVTLKGTLVSHQGVHPISHGYQAGSYKTDKTRLFQYDDERKMHVYASYGNDKDLIASKPKLVYDVNMKDTGFISIRFKPVDVGTGLRTILSLQRDTGTPLGLHVNSANQLVLTLDQQETLASQVVPDDWNQLAVRWSGSSLWIHLNNQGAISRTKAASFENCLLSIGALIAATEPSHHFNGQFEMLSYGDQAFDESKATAIRNSCQTISVESGYDALGRKEEEGLTIGGLKRTAEFTYRQPHDDPAKTSFEVRHMKTLSNQNIYYEYDGLGNVTEVTTPEGIYEYAYDHMGRLVEEYNPVLDQTIKIEYDKQNITHKKYYQAKTTTLVKQMEYSTNQEDQLSCVETIEGGNGTQLDLSYSASHMGNPAQIGSKQLTWEGRRLKQIIDGANTYAYAYNEQGIRTKKVIDGVETKYHLQGSSIIAETKDGNTIHYIRDEQGQLIGFEHQQNRYFYVRDLLGVIRNIIDDSGNAVVTYRYDAWGNHQVYDSTNNENLNTSFIGNINPFRYKGYYHDVETGWYYLQSRYYDPGTSRFVSMDHICYLEPGNAQGVNLFAYCGNNPVMMVDPSGNFAISLFLLGLIIGAIVGATAGGIVAYNVAKDQGKEGWDLVGWTALGIVGGGMIGGALGAGAGALVTKTTGILGLSITKYSIIPIKSVTVLGNIPTYSTAAIATGSGYYGISNKLYYSMTSVQQWGNNSQYLKDAHKLGTQFVMLPDYVVKYGYTLWQELQYLLENGIPYILG